MIFSTLKRLTLTTILASNLLFSSCGYIALTRKTAFITATPEVTVSIAEKEDGPYEEITSRKTKIKLNHFHKRYFIRQERTGFVSNTIELTRTSSNRLKRLDIALAISSNIVATIFTPVHFIQSSSRFGSGVSPSTAQTVLMYTNLGVGLAAWGAIIPIPGKIFPKKVDLPELIPILTKDTNQLFITAGDHEFKLSKNGVKVHDYPTMKQFTNGYGYEVRDSTDEFQSMADLKIYEDISKLLIDAEYGIDSANAALDKTLKLDSRTVSLVYITADEKLRCEVRTAWALETMDELQYLYDKTFHGNSEWVEFNEESLDKDGKESIIRESFVEALDNSFKRFLALDTVQSILSSPVPIPLTEEEELDLNSGSEFVSSVSDAVKSVVTVVTNEGHGSGCVITPDGYIVTNAHVVEDDTTDLKAIMGDDVEKKIPLKFIRMNEAIDLALLKLDTTGLKPLKLALSNQIETGADAYAIGTPADVELGQTVTRGIISGKRKFGGHQLIQTDVAISGGNSGGALIRPDGILMGIVTSEMRSRSVDDIGFAIPATTIEESLKIKINQ
ncbi:MAG: trypsin-like serine protease [Flavobacteriales bacterium]|nr:trypsin-like serine protease [Flavobacteriales bacterium]